MGLKICVYIKHTVERKHINMLINYRFIKTIRKYVRSEKVRIGFDISLLHHFTKQMLFYIITRAK